MARSNIVRKRAKAKVSETDKNPDFLRNKIDISSYLTYTTAYSTSGNTITIGLPVSGVVADSYTATDITVTSKGIITSANDGAGLAPSGPAGGDLAGDYPDPDLATVNASPGAKAAATITVNSKGLVTAATPTLSLPPTGSASAGSSNLGGTYHGGPSVAKITETSGPTALTIGAITDTEFLKRSGASVISATAGSSLAVRTATDANDLASYPMTEAHTATTMVNEIGGGVDNISYVDDLYRASLGSGGGPFGTAFMMYRDNKIHWRTADGKFQPAAITASCWVKPSQYITTGAGRIFAKASNLWPSDAGSRYSLVLRFNVNVGQLDAYLYIAGAHRACVSTVGCVPLNSWSHVGVTYDGSNIKLYVNGRLLTTTAFVGAIDYGAGGPWFLGSDPSGTSGGFLGQMQDFRIANIARDISWFRSVYTSATGKAY
jgi:hypothetical protein